jgi:hypothetical protein
LTSHVRVSAYATRPVGIEESALSLTALLPRAERDAELLPRRRCGRDEGESVFAGTAGVVGLLLLRGGIG